MKAALSFVCLLAVLNGFAQCDPIGWHAAGSIRGLKMGTASTIYHLRDNADNGAFVSTLKKNFQMITPENDFKPQKLWLGENRYDWTDTDWLLGSNPQTNGWAQNNGIEVRGHVLLWAVDQWAPDWLLKQEHSISKDKAREMLQNYISTVVGRYRGKIGSWDVVNEAVDDTQNNGRPYNLRNSFWFRKLGVDFLKYAFIYAHQADPKAELYYNDYSIEGLNAKSDSVFQMLTWLKSQNVPVHGFGMQWHIPVSLSITPNDQHYQNAARFIERGFNIMVTELDVAIPMNGQARADTASLQKQAEVYRSMARYALHFAPKCRAFITWGFTDRYSWIPPFSNNRDGSALPFDSNYQPKLAFHAVQEQLARVLTDGTYRLLSEASNQRSLSTTDRGNLGSIQLEGTQNGAPNQRWAFTWLSDGTYRLSPESSRSRALDAFQESTAAGGVQAYGWWGAKNQRWVVSPMGGNRYRLAPSTVWWRALSTDSNGQTSIRDYTSNGSQHWLINAA
jgi:endo-1,4-beta-xylanase